MFKELVWPWLGEATGTITDAAGKPVAGALVVVTYGAATPVTRKLTASLLYFRPIFAAHS